jgi:hypothetical protein
MLGPPECPYIVSELVPTTGLCRQLPETGQLNATHGCNVMHARLSICVAHLWGTYENFSLGCAFLVSPSPASSVRAAYLSSVLFRPLLELQL